MSCLLGNDSIKFISTFNKIYSTSCKLKKITTVGAEYQTSLVFEGSDAKWSGIQIPFKYETA